MQPKRVSVPAKIEHRREVVAGLLLKGMTIRKITAELPKPKGGKILRDDGRRFSKTTVQNDVAKIREGWRTSARENGDEHFARSLARKESMYAEAREKGQLELANRIQCAIDKLIGLNAPDRHEFSGPNGAPIQSETTSSFDWKQLPVDDHRQALDLMKRARVVVSAEPPQGGN